MIMKMKIFPRSVEVVTLLGFVCKSRILLFVNVSAFLFPEIRLLWELTISQTNLIMVSTR